MAEQSIPTLEMLLGLSDNQVLVYLLQLAGADQLVSFDIAHILLQQHETLPQVFALPRSHLLAFPELEEEAAAFLPLLADLLERYRSAPPQFLVEVHTPAQIERLLLPHFYDLSVEHVYILCLDSERRLLTSGLVAQGGSATVTFSVRRIIDLTMSHSAQGIILAHNHPDGSPLFSSADVRSTQALARQLRLVEVDLLDHYLVAEGRLISMREQLGEQFPG